nr:MAG TPA: hypothetical protein [Caudoviricetes sp.]
MSPKFSYFLIFSRIVLMVLTLFLIQILLLYLFQYAIILDNLLFHQFYSNSSIKFLKGLV